MHSFLRIAFLSLMVCLGFAHAVAAPPKATVYIFTVPDCPVANALMPATCALAAEFTKQGVAFELLYLDDAASSETIKSHAAKYAWTWAVRADPKHELAKSLGAQRTPEAFVILPNGKTAYHGRINDLYYAPGQRRRNPTQHDLRNALEAVVAGRNAPTAHEPAVGCVIADFQP